MLQSKQSENEKRKEAGALKRSRWTPAHWRSYDYLAQYPRYNERLAHFSASTADLYALTMAQALFTNGKHDQNTVFQAYIRKNPFGGSYLLSAGQNIVHEWLDHWGFDEEDIDLLREKMVLDPKTGKKHRLFSDDFLDMLQNAKLALSVEAVPEGELIFPDEPIYRVTGPVWQALMVEAMLLNSMNSQSLFATLSARLREATNSPVYEFSKGQAGEEPTILELGLRRSQAIGGLEATRGAFIGGIDGTANVAAEKYYKIPSTGTMAHALIMLYEDEMEAFRDYAKAMPYNGIFLADTYDTLEGVKKAVQACREQGLVMKGIRLDSGDLATLSIEARKILDEAGFDQAKIAASNDLDEQAILEIKAKGGKIDIWGIGTNLVTAKSQPALGGVYKLGGVYQSLDMGSVETMRKALDEGRYPSNMNDHLRDVIKLSQDSIKVTLPGALDFIRFSFNDNAAFEFDVICDGWNSPKMDKEGRLLQDLAVALKNQPDKIITIPKGSYGYRPLKPMFRAGRAACQPETVHDARARAAEQLARLNQDYRSVKNPTPYPVYVTKGLLAKRRALAAQHGYKI